MKEHRPFKDCDLFYIPETKYVLFYSTSLKNEANKTFFYDEENLFSKVKGLKYISYVKRLKVFKNILKGYKTKWNIYGYIFVLLATQEAIDAGTQRNQTNLKIKILERIKLRCIFV